MANQTTLTFAGDATDLRRAAAQAEAATVGVADSVTESARDMEAAGAESTDYASKLGHLGSAVDGATTAIDSVSGSLQALADIQSMASTKAARQARLIADVEQAQLDLNQAFLDSKQAVVDAEQAAVDITQAQLDATVAQKEYNDAVKEHGAGSAEARQASIDLAQAQVDLKQGYADAEQAAADGAQATRDAKDSQLDLNEAQTAANPPDLQKWADQLGLLTPLLTAAVGVVGLITAAQWAWNAAQLASPTTWIVIAVAAVVAGIVILAMHTEELGKLWDKVWGGIVDASKWAWRQVTALAESWWNRVKELPGQISGVFSKVTGYITAPFKAAFNTVADAWNATIGRLHWTVPGWVPGIGGSSISAPKLPHFHTGGVVPGSLGSETLAVLQAGETVTATSGAGGSLDHLTVTVELVGDGVLKVVRAEVNKRGSVERALNRG